MFDYYVLLLYGGSMIISKNHNITNCICLASGVRSQNLKNKKAQITRDSYALFYFISGKGRVVLNGKAFPLSQGQSFLAFPFSEISIEPDNKSAINYCFVEFSGIEASNIVGRTAFSKNNPVADKIPIPDFEQFFMINECKTDSEYARCRASGKLIILLSFYLEHFPCIKNESTHYVASAQEFIENNCFSPELSVSAVANHIKIDRTYLYRLFKDEMGISVIDYINRRRISKAEYLLTDNDISIKNIAYSVGFTDQMYFSKVFKKLNGKTPTQFRKDSRKSTEKQ